MRINLSSNVPIFMEMINLDFDFVTHRSNAGIDGFTIIDAVITSKY